MVRRPSAGGQERARMERAPRYGGADRRRRRQGLAREQNVGTSPDQYLVNDMWTMYQRNAHSGYDVPPISESPIRADHDQRRFAFGREAGLQHLAGQSCGTWQTHRTPPQT